MVDVNKKVDNLMYWAAHSPCTIKDIEHEIMLRSKGWAKPEKRLFRKKAQERLAKYFMKNSNSLI